MMTTKSYLYLDMVPNEPNKNENEKPYSESYSKVFLVEVIIFVKFIQKSIKPW